MATIRGDDGRVLLSYRSFAGVTGIVAALVSAIVALAGIAAVLLLLAEKAPLRALLALALTFVFATVIAWLVPRVTVTLYDEHHPALTISQYAARAYAVSTTNGATIGELRRSPLSRLGRHRWAILQDSRYLGESFEESLFGALRRKVLGKFNRQFETNVRIVYGGIPVGRIIRRPENGRMDVLELTSDALDRRMAVALATLILGREP